MPHHIWAVHRAVEDRVAVHLEALASIAVHVEEKLRLRPMKLAPSRSACSRATEPACSDASGAVVVVEPGVTSTARRELRLSPSDVPSGTRISRTSSRWAAWRRRFELSTMRELRFVRWRSYSRATTG